MGMKTTCAHMRLGVAQTILLGMLFSLCTPAAALKDIHIWDLAPPFRLRDTAGNTVTQEYLSGHPGAIIFWSTWNPRSKEILQDFRGYHRDYAGRGLRILAINQDGENMSLTRREAVRNFAAELDLPFLILQDEQLEVFVAYGVMAHPSIVLTDPQGRITYTLGGYPPTLREEVRDNLMKLMEFYVESEPLTLAEE